MFKKLALFSPYLAFLSLPIIALTKGKGTVILLAILFLGLCFPYRSIPSIYAKIKDYKHPLCWAILFLIWCGLSILWADAPWTDLAFRYIRLIALLGMGGIAYAHLTISSSQVQHHFYRAFVLGYSFYLLFYIVEIYTQGLILHQLKVFLNIKGFHPKYRYDHNTFLRGLVTLSVLFWAYMGIYRKKLLHAFMLVAFLYLIYGISPDAAFLGMVVTTIIYFVPIALQKLILTGILIGGVATPWISKYLLNENILFEYMRFIPTSHQHRIFMWEELTARIMEKPIFGHGFDFSAFIKSSKLLCNHYSTELMHIRFPGVAPLITYPGGGKVCDGAFLVGIHPHNGFLQIWLELGGIGILLFGIFIVLFYRLIQNNRLAVAMFSFYAVIFSISFNIWQNWMISTLWLGAICLFVVNHSQKDHSKKETIHVST